ncbi:hypothetical protein [Litoribacter populi]|uniref:hypothetical protein n=1 Tax=Litoribacter populi TaxID=2598460 RepID=UPI00117C26E9|nr:hypothetical protein [Litoribacter populi]
MREAKKTCQVSRVAKNLAGSRRRNGEIYISPLSFYLKNGFTVLPEESLESGRISAVKGSWLKIRT